MFNIIVSTLRLEYLNKHVLQDLIELIFFRKVLNR